MPLGSVANFSGSPKIARAGAAVPAKGLWFGSGHCAAHLDRARRPVVGATGAENPEFAKGPTARQSALYGPAVAAEWPLA
jgi:hypothetical protein